MSLYGALFSGVSGLASQSSAMGAISDNITNVNTIGYKGAQVNFQTLVTKQVSITEYSPGGVQSKPRAAIDTQGLLQATSSSTDVALSGQGMFVVNTDSDPAVSGNGMFAYTRAGSFKADKNGYLTNVSGFYLQGWPLTPTNNNSLAKPTETNIDGNTYMKAYKDSTGNYHYCNQNIINPQELKSLNLKTIGGTADQTTQIKMGANLPSGDTVYDPSATSSSGLHETSVLMYDSLGDTHNFNVDWAKTNANQWDVQTQTNVFGSNQNGFTDTSADATAVISMLGNADPITNGGNTTAVTSAQAVGVGHGPFAFFASGGVFAMKSGTLAASNKLPVGSVFQVSGATTSANNGTYVVKTALTTSAAIATAGAQSVTVSRNGTSTTYTGVTAANGAQTMTFTASTGFAVGDIVQVSSSSNNGYYVVTAIPGGAPYTYTLAAADTIATDTKPFEVQRGLQPPSGSASMDVLDSSGLVYGSQARLDFTASSRADVLAMDTKTMSFTVNGKTMKIYFDTTGSVAAATGGKEIVIDLSNTSYTSGSDVANLVANALRNPQNWDNATNAAVASTLVTAGNTLPLFVATGGSVRMVQQVGGPAITVDVSALGSSCTQSQARQWSSAIPTVDTITGKFTLNQITQSNPAITFNGDGTPQSINVGKIGVIWANGAQSMMQVPNGTGGDTRINWFVGSTSQADGMTQLGGTYQLSYLSQNGAKFGNFSSVSIGSDGVVTALFDNGVRRPVFQIPVATFTNPNGLESLTGNSWIETNTSGAYTLRQANNAGAGSVAASSLEASTVDIGTEFTTMIVTQRAYSAAAKIITTADQMLDELVQIKR